MKQDSIYSKLPFKYLRNRHMSVNKLEKLPCIVSIVEINDLTSIIRILSKQLSRIGLDWSYIPECLHTFAF